MLGPSGNIALDELSSSFSTVAVNENASLVEMAELAVRVEFSVLLLLR
jgi:hypothetical protein